MKYEKNDCAIYCTPAGEVFTVKVLFSEMEHYRNTNDTVFVEEYPAGQRMPLIPRRRTHGDAHKDSLTPLTGMLLCWNGENE